MEDNRSKKWLRWGLLNLALVALYGTLMRYKIAFNFPYLEQKNLLHAHSHFAFSGWISHLLYAGLALIAKPYLTAPRRKYYDRLIAVNLVCAFGMLVAFTLQGYQVLSIAFSTLSVFVAMGFAVLFIGDRKRLPAMHPSVPWATGGLLFNILSSAGPFFLGYMMATGNTNAQYYMGAIYFYLHFQYNGWFFFGSMALAAALMPAFFAPSVKYFRIFIIAAVPTFFLSILWAGLPGWLYLAAVAGALLQLGAWLVLLVRAYLLRQQNRCRLFVPQARIFFYMAALALTLKFLLQVISVIPSVSRLVFGFRPVVIAYLHLVLLGVYSIFLTGFYIVQRAISYTLPAKVAAFVFVSGVVLNELLLAVQGFAAFGYIPVPFMNEMLLVAALLLLTGAGGLFFSQRTRS
ncbi:hypothetical protein LL912_09370 [Niabella sp. CC-SYL272]|uniref:hypothetical protein n=1 Tax=Niabella agricola TaxID=2891571 RepID=UPI001F32DC82|nr:hypothetical protein [Niabella agricola]MCF3108986.1 hypothetical protein [Niabella agricola]